MNRQSRKKIITAEGSNAPKSTIILMFSHQRPIVRGANFLVTMSNRSIDQLLELNNIMLLRPGFPLITLVAQKVAQISEIAYYVRYLEEK